MVLGYLILIGILIGGIVLVAGLSIVATLSRHLAARPTSPTDHGCDVPGERYLRGDITTQEYRARRDALR